MKVAWFGRKTNGDHIFKTKIEDTLTKDFFCVISGSKKQPGYQNVRIVKTFSL